MSEEINKIEGEIADIKEKCSTKFGLERRFWVLRIRGQDFYTFKYPKAKIGDYVEIEYIVKDKYKQIINIHKIDRKTKNFFKTEEELHEFLKNIKKALK